MALLISICSFSFSVGATEEDDGMVYMENYGVCIDEYEPIYPSENDEPQGSVNISRYDPRDSNYTTPVKDQTPHGACGIFATMSSFEMTNYKLTGLKYQYSEEAARFVLSKHLIEANGLDRSSVNGFYKNPSSSEWCFAEVASFLSNMNNPLIDDNSVDWVSPVLSNDVPYTTDVLVPTGYWPDNMETSNANAFVSGTECVREDLIKDKIIEYGAVYTVFLADKVKDPDSYNSSTGAWYSETYGYNHAVAVVGWDDNYSRDNFNSNRLPQGDGAWLIKNSMGTSYGEDGYGWISYYDESFNYDGKQARVVTSVEPLSKNEYMLSYDFMPLNYNYGNPFSCPSFYTCNVYDMTDNVDEYASINKVLFYSNCVNGLYEIYISPVNADGSMPDISQLGDPLSSGTIAKDGYITARLQTPYTMNSNVEKYAIIVRYTGADYVFIPREETKINRDNSVNAAKINSGESYYNTGLGWVDLTSNYVSNTYGNYCIRPILERAIPITQDSTLSLYSTYNQGTALSVTVNLNGNQLYSIKKGSTILYEDVAFTRNGNVITFRETFMDGLSADKTHSITFSFTDGADQTLQILPRQLSTVTISGNVAQGQTLTASAICNDDTLPPIQQLTYQWQSSADGSTWTNISGANSSSYTLTADEQLEYIRCQITVSSGNGVKYSSRMSQSTVTKVILYGDADLDGVVSAMDATAIQMYNSKMLDFTPEQLVAADVDGDGVVSVIDATSIQMYIAQMITSFPVEG